MSWLSDVLKALTPEGLNLKQWPVLPRPPQPPAGNGNGKGGPGPGRGPDPAAQARRVLAQAQEEARRMRLEAQRLLAEAQKVRAEAQEAGYRKGFQAGEKAGAEQVRTRLRATLIHLRQLAKDLVEERHQLLAATTRGALDLALAVAKEILTEEITASPQRLAGMLAKARAQLQLDNGQTVKVYVHPEDLAGLASAGAEDQWPGWEFIGDPGLQRGDLILESQRGRLDLRLETQLDRLAGHLTGTGTADGEEEDAGEE